MLFLCYERCTTCQKAKKFLEAAGVSFDTRDIKGDNPSREELAEWHAKSGLPMKRFFNTSGLKYKELALKDRLPGMTESEMLDLLSTDGMLVKRPMLVGEDYVLVGFKEAQWKDALSL